MQTKKNHMVRFVLFSNGIVDLVAALALFFPVFKLPLPDYASFTSELAFVAGGWGIAALTFGIGRIWTSYKPEFYWVMVTLGLIEGTILTAFCLINVFFLEVSLLQAILPLAVGSIYSFLYVLALRNLLRFGRPN